MTVDEMKQIKKERGYTFAQIAELSGVPLGTVQKIFNGETKNPRYDTLVALEKIFNESFAVNESSEAYTAEKRQGQYTIEDYRSIPWEERMELIDGFLYKLGSPTTFHQLIAGEIHRQIANYIMDEGVECLPFMADVDVQLDNDEKTMVKPDVLVICKREQVIRSNIMGPPDLVVEVISPSTKRRDYLLKLNKYVSAGVREYWIVDPYKKRVLVYVFEDDELPVIYPIDGEIPVHIYDGKLVVNFKHIGQYAEMAD